MTTLAKSLIILFLSQNLIFITESKANSCPKDASIKKLTGLKTGLLENTLDKQQISLGNKQFILIINKKNELILSGDRLQQKITGLANNDGTLTHFAVIDWAGDNNEDCLIDLIVWKKRGKYFGKYSKTKDSHDSGTSEKLYIESTTKPKRGYKVQSLGVY